MPSGKVRSSRRLRSWIVDQVNSGKYPGLLWDDDAKTMFRIPWKHAGKQDFRKDEDAAIFKAWAEFKGKLTDAGQDNPASWKTRLRCALNKSPEFEEVNERAQLDISEPYKVYRLVPINEQGAVEPEKKYREKIAKKLKRRRSSSSHSNDVSPVKQIKEEEVSSQLHVENILPPSEIPTQTEETIQSVITIQAEVVNEITLDVLIEESVPPQVADQDSFDVVINYLGQNVVSRRIQGSDVRISYPSSSVTAPTHAAFTCRFPCIQLPEPPTSLPTGQELQALLSLLPYMEKGVLLTSTQQGVYGKRSCQGRVFWIGPHTSSTELHKMERNTEPVLLFCKETFKQQLDNYFNGGERPQCSVTLCFGEELTDTEDLSSKLIIVQVTLPWAEQQVRGVEAIVKSLGFFQTLASQSPHGEITLDLVPVTED